LISLTYPIAKGETMKRPDKTTEELKIGKVFLANSIGVL
jgi:hypothetical protein